MSPCHHETLWPCDLAPSHFWTGAPPFFCPAVAPPFWPTLLRDTVGTVSLVLWTNHSHMTSIIIWVWINTYFHTIFRGMNIHKSQLFWCELQGYKVLTHCHIDGRNTWNWASVATESGVSCRSWILRVEPKNDESLNLKRPIWHVNGVNGNCFTKKGHLTYLTPACQLKKPLDSTDSTTHLCSCGFLKNLERCIPDQKISPRAPG